jgi:hypothetical protein
MAHSIGSIPARASSSNNPITVSQAVLQGETVFVVMLKIVGATDRTGGSLTWGGYTFSQASTTQKAAASPEAGCELWYLVNPLPRTDTLTIPNAGALTIFYQIAMGKAKAGAFSKFDVAAGANGTSANPTPGSVTTTADGDIGFAVTAGGWQTWAPSAQAGTLISNDDDGAHGGGTQYHLQSAIGAIDLGWTFGTSDDWGAVVAYFREIPALKLNNYGYIRVGSGMGTGERIR